MPAVIRTTTVARAVQQLEELSESFRTLDYAEIEPRVRSILGALPAADAVAATRRYGLASPRTKRECIEAVARCISRRKESWDRIQGIGGASPFTS
jgi:hypothetical protein